MADHRGQRGSLFKPKTFAIALSVIALVCLLGWAGFAMDRAYSKNKSFSSAFVPAPSQAEEGSYVTEGAGGADPGTSYVKVVINGQSRFVFGMHFTDVKSVLQEGDIMLEQGDSVSPSLSSPVNENTVITIDSPNSQISTQDTPIAYNVITKNDPSMQVGTEKVSVKGKAGVMQTTKLVRRTGSKVTFSNTIVSFVKTAPTNEVILIGTKPVASPSPASPSSSSASSSAGSSASSSSSQPPSSPSSSSSSSSPSASSSSIGTTQAVGNPQKIAQQMLEEHGWGAEQFTCLVELWQKESGWNVTAENPSGAYGIPQALPGSKMGPGWQTSATVQISWGLEYIATRYGTPCGAWAHEVADNWY
ncbi:MAG: G5 domain-containing protein [Aeriscardovia sp.]|nr:G5 domain-containing protein [Aeriscardovia sp.]